MSSYQYQTTEPPMAQKHPGPGLVAVVTLLDVVLVLVGVAVASSGVFMLNHSALVYLNYTPSMAGTALLLAGMVPLIGVGATARFVPLAAVIAGAVIVMTWVPATLLRFAWPLPTPPSFLWPAADYHFLLTCGIACAAAGAAGHRTRVAGPGGNSAKRAALVGPVLIVAGLMTIGYGAFRHVMVYRSSLHPADPIAVLLLAVGALVLFVGVGALSLSEWVTGVVVALIVALELFILVAPMIYIDVWLELRLGDLMRLTGLGSLTRSGLLVGSVLAGSLLGGLVVRPTASSSGTSRPWPPMSSGPGYRS